MKTRLFFIVLIVLLFSLMGSFKTALAQDGGDPCEDVECCCHTHYDCRGSCQTYSASAPNYSGSVYQTYWTKTDCEPAMCCGGEGDWILEDQCKGWESCSSNGQPTSCCRGCGCNSGVCPTGSCTCNGPYCVFPPTVSAYSDNPLYPQTTTIPTVSPTNIYLPTKLDWDDVNGWYNGGHTAAPSWFSPATMCTPALSPNGGVDCVDSYRITINDLTNPAQILNKALPKSEYNYREPDPLGDGACFLKSNNNYSWQIQACCNPDGTNCSPITKSATWTFYTNSAPEPIGTIGKDGVVIMDPDWNGPEMAENVPLPELIKWCTSSDPTLYEKTYVWATPTDPYAVTEPSDPYLHVFKPHAWNFSLDYYAEPNITDTSFYKCYPILFEGGKCTPEVIASVGGQLLPPAEFVDNNTSSGALFAGYHYLSKLTSYGWQVAACRERAGSVPNYTGAGRPPLNADGCTNYSQYWKFSVANFNIGTPLLEWPAEGATVGVPTSIRWMGNRGTISSKYEVRETGGGIISQGVSHSGEVDLGAPPLKLNTDYTWTVWACWDWEGTKCEPTPLVAHFKVGGSEFNCVYPPDGAKDVPIPVEIKWNPVPWAKSYYVEAVEGAAGAGIVADVVYSTSIYLNYPNVQMGQQYSWRAVPCQDENGLICGQNVPTCSFTTLILGAVDIATLSPANGETVYSANMPINISWGAVPGAKYYKYSIYYVAKSPDEVGNCNPDPANPVITNILSATIDNINLACLGDYRWEIQTCLDYACAGTGGLTTSQFKVVQGFGDGAGGGGGTGGSVLGGLVPCGRVIDDPNTPWNERDKCEIKHLILLIKIIIDFLLWKVGIILLAILVALSGAIYYFSMGSIEAVSQVKLIWKAAGVGYGLLFFSWLIINLFLMLFGYNAGIFGPWYQFNI